MCFSFNIVDWYAISNSLATKMAWECWAKGEDIPKEEIPADKILPMMLSRRLSIGCRLAVECALYLLNKHDVEALVFSSRFSEVGRCEKILKALAKNQVPSPTDFAMSVHNAATGVLTIHKKLSIPATSVAAEENTFEAALFEAMGFLADGKRNVLLIHYENASSEIIGSRLPPQNENYAIALLITGGSDFQCQREAKQIDNFECSAIQFLRGYLSHQNNFLMQSGQNLWTWECKQASASKDSVLSYGVRALTTYSAYVFFGLGALTLTTLWFPLLNLFCTDKKTRTKYARASVSTSFRLFVFYLKTFRVVDLEFKGLERLQEAEGCFLVANHPGLLDYVFIASQLGKIGCIVKSKLQDNFFLKGVVHACDYIPNDKGEAILNECKKRVDQGEVLLVFPEGTRTTSGVPLKLQRGVAHLALRTRTNIEVLSIRCSVPWLTKSMPWYVVPRQRPTLKIERINPIEIKGFIEKYGENYSISARRLTECLTMVLSRK